MTENFVQMWIGTGMPFINTVRELQFGDPNKNTRSSCDGGERAHDTYPGRAGQASWTKQAT